VPRLINQLCDTALVYGFAEQQSMIDAELMQQVIDARRAGGIFPGQPDPEESKVEKAAPMQVSRQEVVAAR
jgi:hypothetical protein